MTFTVFGASGFIGSALARRLADDGATVLTPPRGELPSGPLGHVIYAIGLTGDFRDRPFETVQAHVCVLNKMLEDLEFESFLYLSSTRLYGCGETAREDQHFSVSPSNPSDLYNLSKLMGESLCLNSSKPKVRVARLSNVLGDDPLSPNFVPSIVRDAARGRIALQSARESSKDYISVHDAVSALVAIAKSGKRSIYNIASGRNMSHGEILDLLVAETGCALEYEAGAPAIIFPTIDISALAEDFDFHPQPAAAVLQETIRTLLDKINEHHD